ncbi:unnamed protein product [Timema podura]|uniref:Uncharacterized protein n=1 Tax=Timema podura TaxID=61482 RepID=A0ABN7NXR1_TIMPD|nr:unnamed protein product [Timema podura]
MVFTLKRTQFTLTLLPLDKKKVALYVSHSFLPDFIYYLKNPGRQLKSVSSWQVTTIDQVNFWPNDVIYTPSNLKHDSDTVTPIFSPLKFPLLEGKQSYGPQVFLSPPKPTGN